jgi:hypothetical protein
MKIASACDTQGCFAIRDDAYVFPPSDGRIRAHAGAIVEKWVCQFLGAEEIPTDGRADICPDGKHGDFYLEIKSVAQGSCVPVYLSRREKEERFVRLGHKLLYVLAIHDRGNVIDLKGRDQISMNDLREAVLGRITRLLVVSHRSVCRVAKGQKVVGIRSKMGSKAGYDRLDYARGYQLVPEGYFRKQCTMRLGVKSGLPVYCQPRANVFDWSHGTE